jgi:transcriptional regulator with XRE-family HTH domain
MACSGGMAAPACANAQAPLDPVRDAHAEREIVLLVPLPDDPGLAGDRRPRVQRYRSLSLPLGRELLAFRAAAGLTAAEVAHVLGVGPGTVRRWELGLTAPDSLRRRRLRQLLDGRLWPAIRGQVLGAGAFPRPWRDAVRWYRRASRDVAQRAAWGGAVAERLARLRDVAGLQALRRRYVESPEPWPAAGNGDSVAELSAGRLTDVAYGLRWLELAQCLQFEPRRSLARTILLSWLDETGAGSPRRAGDGRRSPSVVADARASRVDAGCAPQEPP